jgi:hypothetical protein
MLDMTTSHLGSINEGVVLASVGHGWQKGLKTESKSEVGYEEPGVRCLYAGEGV